VTSVSGHEEHDSVYRLIMAGWGSQVVRTLAAFPSPSTSRQHR